MAENFVTSLNLRKKSFLVISLVTLSLLLGAITGYALTSKYRKEHLEKNSATTSLNSDQRNPLRHQTNKSASSLIEEFGPTSAQDILKLNDIAERDDGFRKLLSTLTPDQYLEALADLQRQITIRERADDPDISEKAYSAYEVFAEYLANHSGEKALSLFLKGIEANERGGPELLPEMMANIFRKWAANHFDQASEYIKNNEARLRSAAPLLYHDLLNDLARTWARNDTEKALNWVNQLAEKEKIMAISTVIGSIHLSQPELASQLLLSHSHFPNRSLLAEKLAGSWALESPNAALTWAEKLDDKTASFAAEIAMNTMAENNFSAAKKAFEASQGAARDGAARTLSHHYWLENKDFEGAAEFLDAEPSGEGRNAGVRDLVANWALVDREKAEAWLRSLPSSTQASLDEAYVELATSYELSNDRWKQLDTYGSVQDMEHRNKLVTSSLDQWFRDAPSDVISWIQENAFLSKKEKNQLTSRYQKDPPVSD